MRKLREGGEEGGGRELDIGRRKVEGWMLVT